MFLTIGIVHKKEGRFKVIVGDYGGVIFKKVIYF